MMPDIQGDHGFLKIFQEFISLVVMRYSVCCNAMAVTRQPFGGHVHYNPSKIKQPSFPDLVHIEKIW